MLRAASPALLLAICITPLAWAAAPQGPSFDCSKAANSVEHSICADPRLSASDLALSQNYTAALTIAGPYHDDLLAFQRAWLKRRGPECGLAPSSSVQQPDISDRANCLLGLIKDRAETLRPPNYGYLATQFYDLRNQPPLTLWLLNEAFAEMPFAPRAAEHVFASLDAAPAHLGRLMTARLFDPPSEANTKLQQTLAVQLSEASQGRDMLPAVYDGSISGLVSYIGLGGAGTSALPRQ